MAEGFLRHYAGAKASIYSAGIETHGVNSTAIAIMKEVGIDITHHTSNNMDEYRSIDFDFVITVCDSARERCPYFPSHAQLLHHNFPDPSKTIGTTDEILYQFRTVRNSIGNYCKKFVADHI